MFNLKIIEILKQGKIGVIPTDTIYGLVGSALKEETVKRIYELKKRTPTKPPIILIASLEELKTFDVSIEPPVRQWLTQHWPDKLSVILPCDSNAWSFLHRRQGTLAFRMPAHPELLDLLRQTGPLIAPSANPENLPPAINVAEAKKYFSGKVDFYVDGGELGSSPSTLVEIADKEIKVLRQGEVSINFDQSQNSGLNI